jgi:hypothetical protein
VIGAAATLCGCGADRALEGGPIEVTVVFGEVGTGPGQFSYPRAMAAWADADGEWVLVVDKTARVQRFDARTGEFVGGFRMPEFSMGKPTGLTVGPHPADPERRVVYTADTHYHRIAVFDVPGRGSDPGVAGVPVLTFGEYGTGPGEFVYPTDVELEVGGDGGLRRLYVSEYGGNDRVQVFEPRVDGGVLTLEAVGAFGVQGVPGDGPVVFNRPQELARGVGGELIVVDAINHRIGRFMGEELVGWVGQTEDAEMDRSETGPTQTREEGGAERVRFDHPYSVAVLEDGTALVVEYGSARVVRVDLERGEVMGVWGEPGRGEGQLATPWEVRVLGRRALVLDSGNNRVVAFEVPVAGLAEEDGTGVPRRELTHGRGRP